MFDSQNGFYCQSIPPMKNQFNNFAGMNGFNLSTPSSIALSNSVDNNIAQQ